MDGYSDFKEGLFVVKTIKDVSYMAKKFEFTLDEKEMFAIETVDKNHPHHDWVIAHRSNGLGDNIYLICLKCKAVFDVTNVENW